MIIPGSDSFKESWETVSMTAKSENHEIEVLEFDKNEFEAKGEEVYRNNARNSLNELGSTIDVSIILESESGERIKLDQS